MRRFLQPLLQWKINKHYIFWVCICVCVCVCVCSLSYPACNVYAQYYHLSFMACPGLLYFSTSSQKGHNFRIKKIIDYKMCVFIFSTILYKNFLILRRIERDMIKKFVLVFNESTPYSCQILIKPHFSRQIFEIYWNIKFRENPSRGSLQDGQADRQTQRS